MSPQLISIRLRLTGGTEAAAEAKAAAAGIGSVGKAADAALARSATALSGMQARITQLGAMGARMRKTGRQMQTWLTLPLAGVGFMAVKTAASFDKSMAQVGIATGLGGRALERMRDLAIEMGARTIFSANESAEAMLELSKAGIGAAQIRAGALAATMDLAAAGGQDLATSAVQIGAAMNTFNISADKSRAIADALAGGANRSSADLSDLAEALQQAGQQAVASGLSLFETTGTLAAFADQGIRGSDAGTSLKVFLQRLNPQTAKARELMNELGISFFDSNGRMLDMMGIARELQTELAGMTQKQRLSTMQVLFGTDAMRAANVVFNLSRRELRGYIAATERRGEASRMADAQMEGLPGALEKLSGSLETAALSAGKAAAPAIIVLAGAIGDLADAFTALPPASQTAIVSLAAVVAAAGPTLWVLGHMASAAARIGSPLIGATLWMTEFTQAVREFGMRDAARAWAPTWMKGLVRGLGVAAAGAGLANIIYSATQGDWEAAGVKSAGALAGGLAGGILGSAVPGVGTALGAMIGGGAGTFLAPLVEDLFDTEKKLTPLQERLRNSARALGRAYRAQRQQVGNLAASGRHLERSHSRQSRATLRAAEAQAALRLARILSGPNSNATIQAELRLVRARRRLANATRDARRAERAHKSERQSTMELMRFSVLKSRGAIRALRDERTELFKRRRELRQGGATLAQMQPINERIAKNTDRLRGAQKRQAQIMLEAAQRIGPKFASFLRNSSDRTIEYGSRVKAARARVKELKSALDEMRRSIERTTDAFEKASLEGRTRDLGTQLEGAENNLRNARGGPRRRRRGGALGWSHWDGGLMEVGESGRELLFVPPGASLMPAGPARRWQPESLMRSQESRRGGHTRERRLRPVVVKIGRRTVAEAVVDEMDDEEARE